MTISVPYIVVCTVSAGGIAPLTVWTPCTIVVTKDMFLLIFGTALTYLELISPVQRWPRPWSRQLYEHFLKQKYPDFDRHLLDCCYMES